MTTLSKPDQLRLAADIIEKRLAYEYLNTASNRWMKSDITPDSLVTSHGVIIRVKPEPVMVPLGPEDVPPGSVIRHREWSDAWQFITGVYNSNISFNRQVMEWDEIVETHEIKRPGQDWQPCHKPAE